MNVVPKLIGEKVTEVKFDPATGCNTPDEVMHQQVEASIRRGLPQVQPHPLQPAHILLVCGGKSLETTERELVEAHWAGGKVIAVNGAYNWCIEHNIRPSGMVMLDARESVSRFIERPVEGCKYFLASQCHPKTFDMCRGREVFIWHACSGGDDEVAMLKRFYFDRTFPITLGTTVGVRSISLMRMLGFPDFDVFGLDSCWLDGGHHAYDQPENARDLRIPVWLRPQGRDDKALRFECAPWHIKQADDFMALIKERGDLFRLNVHGPGLIATILKTGAEIQLEET